MVRDVLLLADYQRRSERDFRIPGW